MEDQKSGFQWFPKTKELRSVDAFFYLILLGTFGAHQFYLGNKRRALYLLITCGISHLFLILFSYTYPYFTNLFGFKLGMLVLFSGYLLGAPVWIWDFITLTGQVRDKNGQADLL